MSIRDAFFQYNLCIKDCAAGAPVSVLHLLHGATSEPIDDDDLNSQHDAEIDASSSKPIRQRLIEVAVQSSSGWTIMASVSDMKSGETAWISGSENPSRPAVIGVHGRQPDGQSLLITVADDKRQPLLQLSVFLPHLRSVIVAIAELKIDGGSFSFAISGNSQGKSASWPLMILEKSWVVEEYGSDSRGERNRGSKDSIFQSNTRPITTENRGNPKRQQDTQTPRKLQPKGPKKTRSWNGLVPAQ
ncbi:hypothetical protein ACLOJK_009165 [Asimina triloba]